MAMKNPIIFLRKIARWEEHSFMALVGIAMPLKYAPDLPQAVRVVGSVHGLLFVVFCVSLLQTMLIARWPLGRSTLIFLSALVPFGPLLLDRRMGKYEQEFAQRISAPVSLG